MKKNLIYAKRCDYCKREITLNGKESDGYVVTAELKTFCLIQTPGKTAERDCMKNYLNDLNGKQKKYKEEKKIILPRVLAKLDALQKEFKDREWKERLSKHPT
jgi:CRISPR/Cas system CMR-associated protein Cmr1 (group 7 of RAMP superfamily)